MKPEPVTVSAHSTLQDLVDGYIYRYHFKLYPVINNGRLGCITIDDVKNVPRREWETHTVSELMHPCDGDNSIKENEDAIRALAIMNRTGNTHLIVTDSEGKLTGVVAIRDLMRFLSLKLNLDVSKSSQNDRE